MKQPKTQLQEVLYLLLHFSKDKRKAISQQDIRDITYQNAVTARISDLRRLGVTVTYTSIDHKNKFGRNIKYAKYFIPSNEIEQAESVYNQLTSK